MLKSIKAQEVKKHKACSRLKNRIITEILFGGDLRKKYLGNDKSDFSVTRVA